MKAVHLSGVSIVSVLISAASCCLITASGDSSMQVNGGIHRGGTICCCRFSSRLRRMSYMLSRMLENWLSVSGPGCCLRLKASTIPSQFCVSDGWPSKFN